METFTPHVESDKPEESDEPTRLQVAMGTVFVAALILAFGWFMYKIDSDPQAYKSVTDTIVDAATELTE